MLTHDNLPGGYCPINNPLSLAVHQPGHMGLTIDEFMTFMSEALPGNTHLHRLHLNPSAIDRGQTEKDQWVQVLKSDTFEHFQAALSHSNVFEIDMPMRSQFTPENMSGGWDDGDRYPEADCARVRGWIESLRRICARNGVRLMAANDPAMTHFDAMTSGMYHPDCRPSNRDRTGPVEQESKWSVSLTDDDVAICMEIARALACNTHVQTVQTAINDTLWSTDAAVDCMIENLPHSRVVDVDIARYQCNCNGETSMMMLEDTIHIDRSFNFACCEMGPTTAWCHRAKSVRAAKARLLMEACFENALERLKSNDPTLRKLKYHNKYFEADHIDRLASAIGGNRHVETLVICDAGIDEDEINPDPRLRATWRHDQATMAVLKTAIRQSTLTSVELFSKWYGRREKCPHHDSSTRKWPTPVARCRPLLEQAGKS